MSAFANPVGFVGLGAMGARMAARLLARDRAVVGFNRTRDKATWLAERGLVLADSPREVAEAASVILVMVLDPPALDSIAAGPDGLLEGLGPGSVVVDMSAVGPEAATRIGAAVEARGASFLEAPVSGSLVTVDAGELSFMVGGDPAVLDEVRGVLLELGKSIVHVGGRGSAAAMKIAVNVSVGMQILAFAESLLLAERSGIASEVAMEVLLSSVIASPMLKYRGPFFLEMPADPAGKLGLIRKDLDLALDMARQAEVPLPGTALTRQLVSVALAMGLADEDMAAIGAAVRRMAGE